MPRPHSPSASGARASGASAPPPAPAPSAASATRHVHGDRGVYYAGSWVDIEDLGREWACPRTAFSGDARAAPPAAATTPGFDYDVAVIGAGCVGAAVVRELSRLALRVVLLERSDDVTQGATKGNSGIVHAGYDDEPGSQRARFCWKGNQMFTQLDRELRFGLQRNGSLVVARGAEDEATLQRLLERGAANGVKNLRIVGRDELRRMEPYISADATAALFSPDAATLTPYEFTIALAENAVDNGVELRLRRTVTALETLEGGGFVVQLLHAREGARGVTPAALAAAALPLLVACVAAAAAARWRPEALARAIASLFSLVGLRGVAPSAAEAAARVPPIAAAVAVVVLAAALAVLGAVGAMRQGGVGGAAGGGARDETPESLRARFVVNAAGLGSGDVARLAGDTSFYIKPRVGEYLLMHKKEGFRARHVLFPAPGKMGKGVLVQTTLWGNLILGPTAADLADPSTALRTPQDIMEAILARCRDLVPSFDAGEVIHSFAGLRAKSSTGDWIVRASAANASLVHAAGIDSPGLAGSPAIAAEVVAILRRAGLPAAPNPGFNPNRRPIIVVKDQSPKAFPYTAFPVRADGSAPAEAIRVDGDTPSTNVVCRCERVTEAEILDACSRSLPCASSQAVRKRTRAGMGHCQGEFCEPRVRAILARAKGTGVEAVPGRPWPASSILPRRHLDDADRDAIRALVPPPAAQ